MRTDLIIALAARLNERTSSLDDLVLSVQELLTQTTVPELIAAVLQVRDAALLRQWRDGALSPPSCCDAPAYAVRDWQPRQVRTRVGVVHFRWRRLCCRHCHHGWVPLRDALGLTLRQPCSAELAQLVIEESSKQSYRQVEATLENTAKIVVPKSTAHRWVRQHEQTTPADPADRPTALPVIVADGTNYHRRPVPGPGGSTRGEVRLVLGVTAQERWHLLGEWSGASWETIAQDLIKRSIRAICLVADGEPGLHAGLSPLVQAFQRCHWHLPHDLDAVLLTDHVAKDTRREWQARLAHVLAVEVPPRSHGAGTPTERTEIAQARQRAAWHLEQLIQEMGRQGWSHGVTYLRDAQPYTFTYIDLWLKDGMRVPRTTSYMERVMETLARRLKLLAKNWAEQGAAQMAAFVLQQQYECKRWIVYWKQRLRLSGTVQLKSTVMLL
jgi:hypothetical protein